MGAKFFDQVDLGDTTVFHHIVQKCCHQRLAIEFPFGALQAHSNGMGDIGFATAPGHSQMGLIGKTISSLDVFNAIRT